MKPRVYKYTPLKTDKKWWRFWGSLLSIMAAPALFVDQPIANGILQTIVGFGIFGLFLYLIALCIYLLNRMYYYEFTDTTIAQINAYTGRVHRYRFDEIKHIKRQSMRLGYAIAFMPAMKNIFTYRWILFTMRAGIINRYGGVALLNEIKKAGAKAQQQGATVDKRIAPILNLKPGIKKG